MPEIPRYDFARVLPPAVETPLDIYTLTSAYERLTRYLTDGDVVRSEPLPEHEREAILKAYENPEPFEEVEGAGVTYGPSERQEGYGFISYARDDIDAAMPVIQDAFGLGYQLWWDEGIPGGAEWLRHLEEKVERAAFLLLFLSRRSAASEFVLKEVGFALRYGKPVVTVRLDRAELPPDVVEALGRFQMLDASSPSFEENFARTLRRVAGQGAGPPGAGSSPAPPAA